MKNKKENLKNENNFVNQIFKRENFGVSGSFGIIVWILALVIVFNQNAPLTGKIFFDFLIACCCAPIYLCIFIILLLMKKTK